MSKVARAASTAHPTLTRRGGTKRRSSVAGTTLRRFAINAEASQALVVDRQTPNFIAVEDPEAAYPGVETFTPLGDPHHFRVQGATDHAFGSYEFCGMGDGFFVAIFDTHYAVPLSASVLAENMLRVRVAIDGDGEYATERGELLDYKGASASIIIEPNGQPAAEAVSAGRNIGVDVYIHRDILVQLYGRDSHELPPVLHSFIAGNLRQTVARRLPLTPRLLGILEDLQSCRLEGRSRRLVIRSKAIEILCHAFEELALDERYDAFAGASKLAVNGVLKAQQLLAKNYVTPPSLGELAHELGMSRSGLCAAFRQIVGQSVYEYVGDLRMQHALEMLNRQNASIAEIAYAVGYGHSSSFSFAVQRRFGITASELRRRRSAPI